MTQSHSVTLLIQGLRGDKQASEPAVAAIWQRYSSDLLQQAHKRMSAKIRQRTGSEDVVQDAFATFCRRFRTGEFVVTDRDDLLRLLIGITIKKTLMTVRYHTQDRRSVGREIQTTPSNGREERSIHDFAGERVSATVEDAAVFEELYERGLSLLDGKLREIAVLLIEGLDCIEIAKRLDVTVRTIERKRIVIRQIWKENGMDDRVECLE